MTGQLYGMVKKHRDGTIHLVRGRTNHALCGARAHELNGWTVVMRGLLTRESAAKADGVCRNCLKEAEAA